MAEMTATEFGDGKTFFEIEQCDQLSAAGQRELSKLCGDRNARTIIDLKPRPLCHVSDGELLLVLRGVNLNPNSDPEDMIAVRIWLNNDCIIVSQRRPVMSVDAVQARLHALGTPMEVALQIAAEMFDRVERYIIELDEKVDDAEDAALADPNKKRRMEILEFRRAVIALRRYLLPQRESLMTLSRTKSTLLNAGETEIATELYFRSARITDQLDAIRERLSLIQEEITATITDAINQNMYVLSIISLVFLPLGFLTGLFGINVGGMPMVADGAGGLESIGFWVVAGLCAVSAAIILLIMRIKKWL